MKVRIDKTKCIGCDVCVDICPEGIEMVNGIAEIKDENAGCLKDAANACPQKAIVFNGEKSNNRKVIDKTFSQNYGQERRINQGMGRGAGKGRGLGRGPRDGRGGGRGGGGRRRW